MLITDDNKKDIVNFGSFRYSTSVMANILDFPESDIKKEYRKKDSEFRILYEKGVDLSKYVIDKKLFELAKTGDMRAINKYEERVAIRKRTNK